MKVGDYITFRYKGKPTEGVIVRVITDPLHPSSLAVAIGSKTVKVMQSEVLK